LEPVETGAIENRCANVFSEYNENAKLWRLTYCWRLLAM
jgi:hypothetical protein